MHRWVGLSTMLGGMVGGEGGADYCVPFPISSRGLESKISWLGYKSISTTEIPRHPALLLSNNRKSISCLDTREGIMGFADNVMEEWFPPREAPTQEQIDTVSHHNS